MDKLHIAKEISISMPKVARRVLLEFFQQIDIPQTQVLLIMALYEHDGPVSFSVLSTVMHVSPPTMTGLVDRLEKGGYAKRQPSADDRRVIHVVLTNKGKEVGKKFRTIVSRRWKEILDKIPDKDAQSFLRIIKSIEEVL